ncbi:MAG: hypothetical protein AB4042_10775 [Leptolyngbyaceae cyanobacterium]
MALGLYAPFWVLDFGFWSAIALLRPTSPYFALLRFSSNTYINLVAIASTYAPVMVDAAIAPRK